MSGLELILNNSTTTGVPGGFNAGRVQNDMGDLCLWSSNQNGIRISAPTGYVGIGTTAASSYALDVSGNARISGLATYTSNVGIGKTPNVALDVSGSVAVSGALTVQGTLYASNVSVLGTTEIVNAYETHSSNVVITNYGTGPGLTVTQVETTSQPVAAFYAGIGAANPALLVNNLGQVAIGKPTAAYALDVSGNVNVSGLISTGNSCSLRYWTVSGTLPSSGGAQGALFPVLLTDPTKIVACYGTYMNAGAPFPFNTSFSTAAYKCSMWCNTAGVYFYDVGATAQGSPYTVIIVTSV